MEVESLFLARCPGRPSTALTLESAIDCQRCTLHSLLICGDCLQLHLSMPDSTGKDPHCEVCTLPPIHSHSFIASPSVLVSFLVCVQWRRFHVCVQRFGRKGKRILRCGSQVQRSFFSDRLIFAISLFSDSFACVGNFLQSFLLL